MKKDFIIADIDKVLNSTTSTLSDEDKKILLEIQEKLRTATSDQEIIELFIQLLKFISVGAEIFVNHQT